MEDAAHLTVARVARELLVTNEILLRLCRSFDLDADIAVTNTHLSRDAFLVRLVATRPASSFCDQRARPVDSACRGADKFLD
jgi:hypothetical protein